MDLSLLRALTLMLLLNGLPDGERGREEKKTARLSSRRDYINTEARPTFLYSARRFRRETVYVQT